MRRRIWFSGLLVAGIGLAIFFITILINDESSWGRPHVVDLVQFGPLLGKLPVANPKLRFWDVLGLFGTVVYIWYVIRWRWFVRMDYINLGMAIPLLTLFNPIFVIWFLHLGSWDSLWRFSYLMPVSIVGAILVGFTLYRARGSERPGDIIIAMVSIGVLLLTLVPFSYRSLLNNEVRLPSLVSVEQNNGAKLWIDLIEFVNTVPNKRKLITDSVTNYVLTTSTKHSGKYGDNKGGGDKSSWQKRANPFFSRDYKDWLKYYRLDGSLLIINLRDGDVSETGRISGHWWENILKVSTEYPEDLHHFVEDNPSDFELLWHANRIWVYEILRDPAHYASVD